MSVYKELFFTQNINEKEHHLNQSTAGVYLFGSEHSLTQEGTLDGTSVSKFPEHQAKWIDISTLKWLKAAHVYGIIQDLGSHVPAETNTLQLE